MRAFSCVPRRSAAFPSGLIECLLNIAPALLYVAFHLLSQAFRLLRFVTSYFSNFLLNFACYILGIAFHLIAVHGRDPFRGFCAWPNCRPDLDGEPILQKYQRHAVQRAPRLGSRLDNFTFIVCTEAHTAMARRVDEPTHGCRIGSKKQRASHEDRPGKRYRESMKRAREPRQPGRRTGSTSATMATASDGNISDSSRPKAGCCRDLIDPVCRRGYRSKRVGGILDRFTTYEDLGGSIPTSARWVIPAPAPTIRYLQGVGVLPRVR